MEAQILVESLNPSGTLQAIVEQTSDTVYFYITPNPNLGERFSMRACWVRNLKQAPKDADIIAMENGEAPMLPEANCNHPEGLRPFKEGELSVVWYTSEDGAAVCYQNEVLALIPGWSLYNDPSSIGYAKDCKVATETLFPLLPDNEQLKQIDDALKFIDSWSQQQSPWLKTQQYFLDTYESVFGKHLQYYSIDGGKWPPIAMAKFAYNDLNVFLTLGISQRPMPWVDFLYPDTSSDYRRMELGLAVEKSLGDEYAMQLAQGIAGLANMPWNKISWLGEGHTISSNSVQEPFESLIVSSALYNGPVMPPLSLYDEKVNLYWAQLITLKEREFAHSRPNGGYDLLETMINNELNWVIKGERSSLY